MLLRCVATVVLAAGVALAQGGGRGGGGGMGGDEGGMGGGMSGGGMGEGGGMPRAAQRQSRLELFVEKLKLNGSQKEDAVKILSEAAQKASPISQQIMLGRQYIANAMLQKKSDEEIKGYLDRYTKVCAQMTALEAEAFTKIYEELKPNQQKNAPQAFDLLAGVFMPQSAGAGRGSGRNGGGRK